MAKRPIVGRVLVRLFQSNPRRFLVRDPQKLQQWIMLSRTELGTWEPDKHHGIRVEVVR